MKYSFKRIYKRFRDYGGLTLVSEYTRMGLFPLCCKEAWNVLFLRKDPMDAYGNIIGQVGQILRLRYQHVLDELEAKFDKENSEGHHSNKVWVCWLQGMDKAPGLVKACYLSLLRYLEGREVVLLDYSNIHKYVTLPGFIEEKYRKGIITNAHYTDILRLELLIKYGGTWIDSTVLCTGNDYPEELFNSDLFVFQYLKKETNVFLGLSNWFITSCSGNWVLKELRDLLFSYWRDYDCVVHYYMFHLFFTMIMEKHPEVAMAIPKHGNKLPHYLSRIINEKYDEDLLQELKKRTCFHKLSYRLAGGVENSKDTFYNNVIKDYLYYE